MPLRFSSAGRNVAAGLLLVLSAAGCLSGTGPDDNSNPSDPTTETFASSLGINLAQMTEVSPDLFFQDLIVGTGTDVVAGKNLTVTYTGWLANGTQFQTNVGGTPFPMVLGIGYVIPGWDQGLVGMKVGGKRRLVIGSNLGYGPSPNGNIPGNSTLVFDVQVLTAQ